jgi:hypothetical protein
MGLKKGDKHYANRVVRRKDFSSWDLCEHIYKEEIPSFKPVVGNHHNFRA